MLKKMGYKSGDGLGKTNNGRVEPIQVQRKMDRAGLGKENTRERRNVEDYGVTFDFNEQSGPERRDRRGVSKPPTLESIREIKTARALYDFGARGDAGGTLSLRAGQLVDILDDSNEYWWRGVNEQGEEGYFPGCVATLDYDKEADRNEGDASHPVSGDSANKA